MTIDWWTLAIQAINLLVLAWLLGRFLFRPIARIVEERQASVRETLDAASAAQEQAEQARRDADAAKARMAAERERRLEEVQAEGAKERERLVAAAREEADKLIDDAREEIDRMHATEAADNGKQASILATDIAMRLLDRLPDEARIAGFLAGLESAIATLPEKTRMKMTQDGELVVAMVARPLSEEAELACRKAIAAGAGGEVVVKIKVEPDIIAGIEVEAGDTVVRNSFRADLERISEELTREGKADG